MLETLYLHPTSRCNLRCVYCYMDREYAELPPEAWIGFLKQAAQAPPQNIVITGGEPLLYPGLFELAAFCRAALPSALLRLMTNGTLVNDDNAHRFTVFGEVRVSVDGGEERTDALRGEGVTSRARRALRFLEREGVKVGASVTIPQDSADSPRDIAREVRHLGFTSIYVHPLKSIGRAKKLMTPLTDAERQAAPAPYGVGLYLNITPDGGAYPCHALNASDFCLGNITRDSYEAIRKRLAALFASEYPPYGACLG